MKIPKIKILSNGLAWALLLLSAAPVLHAKVAPPAPVIGRQKRLDRVPGEFIVKYRSAQSDVSLAARALVSSGRALGGKSGRSRYHLVHMKPDSPRTAASLQSADPSIEYVQPNYIYYADAVPNDTHFGLQWPHNNTGQNVNGTVGTSDADMDTVEAWNLTTGTSTVIVVAVLDTGVDIAHPDLAANIWVNAGEVASDGIDNDGNGFVDDVNGWDTFDGDKDPRDYHTHGTHVAGIIGAVGNNGAGIAGVAWKVAIMPVKIMGVQGFATTASEIAGIQYAMDNGARIINASWGGFAFDQALKDVIDDAAANDVLFIAAAGNNTVNTDFNPHYPSGYASPNIISVAALTQTNGLASFSNYGATSVDVGAPGTNIYSTIPGLSLAARSPIFTDNFDSYVSGTVPNRWIRSGSASHPNPWTVKTGAEVVSGTKSLQDSPDGFYANNANSFLWLNPSMISGHRDCTYEASFRVKFNLENNFDFLAFLASPNRGDDTSLFTAYTGTSGGVFMNQDVTLPDLSIAMELGVDLGFWLTTDETTTQDGVKIDDFTMYKRPLSISTHTYAFMDGTSMAAPEVAGVAALVRSVLPYATYTQVKTLLLTNVDAVAALSGKATTGGRVNAQKAVTAAKALALSTPSTPVPTVHGTSSITWTWSDLSNETGYRFRNLDNEIVSPNLPAGTVSWTQTGLPAGSQQFLYLEAFNNHDFKYSSPYGSAYTFPKAPTGLKVSERTPASIAWSWQDNASNETGYRVRRSSDNADLSGALSPNTKTWVQSGLGANQFQSVYVESLTPLNKSSCPAVSGHSAAHAPVSTALTAVYASSVTLTWSTNGNPASVAYNVQKWNKKKDTKFKNAGVAPTNSITLMGLAPKAPYLFRVAAINSDGVLSTYDVKISTKMDALPAGAPEIRSRSLSADATLDMLKAYPNPFHPSQGQSEILFEPLPEGSTIKIFTPLGEEVREMSSGSGGRTAWDGRNQGGQPVASGTYVYFAESPEGHKKSGRVLVIR